MSIRFVRPAIVNGTSYLVDGVVQSFSAPLEDNLVNSGIAESLTNPRQITVLERIRNDNSALGVVTAEVDPSTGEIVQTAGGVEINDYEPAISIPQSTTSWLFVHPSTLVGGPRTGERQVYIPTKDKGVYFGAFFGSRSRANTLENLTDLCLARTGLYVWHSACSKLGTWVNGNSNPSQGAFSSNGTQYSKTNGDTITATGLTGDTLAAQIYLSTNCGYAIVSVDGDFHAANRLPEFTYADLYSGRCRTTDIGKRYLCGYSGTAYGDCVVIADGLDAESHTVTAEICGTKPAASTDTRVYFEAFAACNGQTPGSANVHFVPIFYISHIYPSWSAMTYVPSWAPVGSSNYQFMGDVHSDGTTQSKEVLLSNSVFVNATDKSSQSAGTYSSGEIITLDQSSTIAHVVDFNNPVINKSRKFSAAAGRSLPLMCDVSLTYVTGGQLQVEYGSMMHLGEMTQNQGLIGNPHFTRLKFGGRSIVLPSAHNNSTYNYPISSRKIEAAGKRIKLNSDIIAYYPCGDEFKAGLGLQLIDRTQGDTKIYSITCSGPLRAYNDGESVRIVTGFNSEMI